MDFVVHTWESIGLKLHAYFPWGIRRFPSVSLVSYRVVSFGHYNDECFLKPMSRSIL